MSSSSASLRTWHLPQFLCLVPEKLPENLNDSKDRFGVREKWVWSLWIGEALGFWRKNVFGMDGSDVWDAWTAGIKQTDYIGK